MHNCIKIILFAIGLEWNKFSILAHSMGKALNCYMYFNLITYFIIRSRDSCSCELFIMLIFSAT